MPAAPLDHSFTRATYPDDTIGFLQNKNNMSAGAFLRESKKHVSAGWVEVRAEVDADQDNVSCTSAIPPDAQDAVLIFCRAPVTISTKQLVWQGSRVPISTERRPGRPQDDMQPGSGVVYVIVVSMRGSCWRDPEYSSLVRPKLYIHYFSSITTSRLLVRREEALRK